MSQDNVRIDLHMHSTASDGTLSPRELVRLAKEAGLTTMALTDHDTLFGLDDAKDEADKLGIEFIRGCELSSDYNGKDIDVLGLWAPSDNITFSKGLERLENLRLERCLEMLQKLNKLGLEVTAEELQAMVGYKGRSPGRPHLARLLVKKGYSTSVKEAFDRYLGDDGPAYVPKLMLTPKDAVTMLREAGATPAIAHPMLIRISNDELSGLVKDLVPHGLMALEAFHSEHRESGTRFILDLALLNKLEVCGGSDFHGSVKPGIKLGVGHGNLHIPAHILDGLKRQRVRSGLPI